MNLPNKIGAEKKPNRGRGRPKGSRNKLSRDLKAMILGALEKAGGVEYLTRQATENPVAFLALLGRVLPMTLAPGGKEGAGFTLIIHTAVDDAPARSLPPPPRSALGHLFHDEVSP